MSILEKQRTIKTAVIDWDAALDDVIALVNEIELHNETAVVRLAAWKIKWAAQEKPAHTPILEIDWQPMPEPQANSPLPLPPEPQVRALPITASCAVPAVKPQPIGQCVPDRGNDLYYLGAGACI